ncbi:MAG: hypothetical protein KAS49_01860, partial [Candidatus Cloacimonetes bacterium]|nr:hypothetical protein [Candidatus Cloacimonadota bacterium]
SIFQLERINDDFQNIDLKGFENIEIIINDKKLKFPKDLDELSEEKLKDLIKEQFGENTEIEIKIIKTSTRKDENYR